ncbi:MAG: UDP-N-acetylmuramoyl-L-alanine--D-glutamate ligase [Patescibacteria group bacterium]|nr:UDP-N-acetylmuramoyl-L-alanine--D-glutamate ligase [Patescibacteria group bacterium]
MNVAVVGFATEGRISLDYFLRQGHSVTVCDQDESIEVPTGVATQLGVNYLDNLDRFDIIVRTAGMQPSLILEKNPDVEAKITTAVNEFLAHCPTKNTIGITGTKGKGTTSTLTAKMLETAGKKVWLGGNIGNSPLESIDQIQPEDWVVLELSSFQLIDLKHSPHIGVCLMIVPEHLNWHKDYEEYIAAKQQLFMFQMDEDIAIYYAKNEESESVADATTGKLVPYFAAPGALVEQNEIKIDGTSICRTNEMGLLGAHNLQNACAAITAVWHAGVTDPAIVRRVLTTFTGLEHRLEFVRELAGVKYYDDSFGTTPETAIVALEAFSQPKVVILGGSDKGASYDELADAVAKHTVRHVVLIGDEAPKIRSSLDKLGFTHYTLGLKKMPEIVATIQAHAHPGDIALLSTGCASFGLFENYKDRGNQFKQAVLALS